MGTHHHLKKYIKALFEIEKQLGCRIFFVGGYVRDLILHTDSKDIDFCVEGNGIDVARAVHKQIGGDLTVYKKFLTSSLKLKNSFILDFATARTETYPAPASMPVVKPAKLKDDLYRRDFTINAIALPLLPTSLFPIPDLLIDPCGGYSDIKNKLIRVLHKKSFIDDPTRILRAIRYSVRFGFKSEKNTAKWMEQAIKDDLLNFVSAPRLRDEFIKALEEQKAKKIFTEFEKNGILKYFGGNFDISRLSLTAEPLEKRIKKLLANQTPEQKSEFIKKFCLPARVAQ